MTTVEVHLFARLRELAGSERVFLVVPDDASIADVRAALRRDLPQLAGLLPSCVFAVDNAYADEASPATIGGEIACIPPVSGG
jgi:molybdopterin converting factor small subunit